MISQIQIDEYSWGTKAMHPDDLDNFWSKVNQDLNKPPISVRTSVLNEAEKIVNGQRANTYGGPEDSFKTIAKLWEGYTTREFSPADVAVMLALLKIARLKHSPEHRDSWVDLAGYAACGAECGLKGKE
ncbi:MAG: DUF6378 domain-containing protein [Candidatus Magasanikiibacteriota bacterium]